MGAVGPLFPWSWKTASESECKGLHGRPDYMAAAHVFDHILKNVTPVFDKCTEDGVKFRIYRSGSLEVRTTQEPSGAEIVGMVLSCHAPIVSMEGKQVRSVQENERVVKVTEYVKNTWTCYFVVLRTEAGNVVVTELLENGAMTWEENPEDLDYRTSLSKSLRSVDCAMGVTLRDVKRNQCKTKLVLSRHGVSQSKCKHYARSTYNLACGKEHREPQPASTGADGSSQGEKVQRLMASAMRPKMRPHMRA